MRATNLIKGGLNLVALRKKGPEATKTDKFAGIVDAATTGVDTGKDVDGFVGAIEEAKVGDSTVGMVAALDAKVDVVAQGVESLRAHQFGKEKYAVGAALSKAVSARDVAQSSLDAFDGAPSEGLMAKAREVKDAMRLAAQTIRDRLIKMEQLVKARDPAKGGGGELAQGTKGRSAFDLVAAHPGMCKLFAETTLHVQGTGIDDYTQSEERSAFWPRVEDEALRTDLHRCLFTSQAYPVRPSFVQKGDLNVPTEIGRPLSTLIGQEVMPFERVQMKGRVIDEWVTRERWDDPEQRPYLFVRAAPTPTELLGGGGQ